MSDAPKPIRSPSYPNMSLRDAIAAVRKIESEYRKTPADREHAAKLIGYSSLSGPAAKALAALAQYGLVERAGKGELRVSDRASILLHPSNPEERFIEIQKAAFEPDLFREFQDRWPELRPPEDAVANLLRRSGFNESAIRPITNAYLDTLALLEESRVATPEAATLAEPTRTLEPATAKVDTQFGGAKIGDLVQWESGGVLQFEEPKLVRAISEDGEWVAVEGSETGIPMAEIIVEHARVKTATPRFEFSTQSKGQSLSKGEVEWMRNKLSSNTSVRLLVEGEIGPKEIGRLIKLLEAQKLILEEED